LFKIVLLDGDSENDSDTEFEDDIVIPMPKSSSAAEEIRINLEKCLGEKVIPQYIFVVFFFYY